MPCALLGRIKDKQRTRLIFNELEAIFDTWRMVKEIGIYIFSGKTWDFTTEKKSVFSLSFISSSNRHRGLRDIEIVRPTPFVIYFSR